MGIKQGIKRIARKIVGFDEISQSVKTVYFYENHLHNIQEFPAAGGDIAIWIT